MPPSINMPPRIEEIQRLKNEIHALKEQLKNSKQISKFVYNNIGNSLAKFQNHHHIKKLKPYHEQATELLHNPRDKVKTIKQFKAYIPERIVQVKIQIFRGRVTEDDIRMDEGKAGNGRQRLPDEYVVKDGGHYIGHVENSNDAEIVTLTNVPLKLFQTLPYQMYNVMVGRAIFKRDKIGIALTDNSEIAMFEEFSQKLGQNENNASLSKIDDVSRHYPIILIVESYEIVGNQNVRPLPSVNLMTLRKNDRRMTNKFLKYAFNENATCMKDMFVPDKYYIDNSCLANAIMNLVADKYNKAYKTKENLTYELIARLTNKSEVFHKEGCLPLSFEEAKSVFKHLRIRAEQRHENGSLEASYHPQDDDVKVDTFIGGQSGLLLMYIRKDDHAYYVNDPNMKKSLTETPQEKFNAKKTLSDKFPIPKDTIELKGCVHNFQELIKYIKEFKSEDENKVLKLLWLSDTSLLKLLKHLYFECNFIPEVGFSISHVVTKLSFYANDIKVILLTPTCGKDTFTNHSLNNEECMRHAQMKAKAMSKICNKYCKSSYGEGVKEMFLALGWTVGFLPQDKPRYFMGIGLPDQIVKAVGMGVGEVLGSGGHAVLLLTSYAPMRIGEQVHKCVQIGRAHV